MAIIDDRTTNLNLPLPNIGNKLVDDVARLRTAFSSVDTAIALKADAAITYSKVETDSRIQAIVGAAPAALDTLAEIATQLASDEFAAAALVTTVSGKVDKVAGKGLSTEDYTTAEKTKLAAVTGVNTGDETLATIKTKLGVTTLSGSNTGDQVIPVAASTTPAALGVGAVGTGLTFARADHVHTSPTTITGNAGTATKLATAVNINGVAFDGSAAITINGVDSTARVASSLLGANSGVATLDASGKVPSTQLPSYVDDVLEYINLAGFSATGTAGIIYVAQDTNKIYRWSGTAYIEISPTAGNADTATKLATARTINGVAFDGSAAITINAVDSTARATGTGSASGVNTGDQVIPTTLPASDVSAWAKSATKPAYTATEVGLANVNNTTDLLKPVSTATQAALNLKANQASVNALLSGLTWADFA